MVPGATLGKAMLSVRVALPWSPAGWNYTHLGSASGADGFNEEYTLSLTSCSSTYHV